MLRKPTIVAVLLAGLLLALPASSPARGGDDDDGGGGGDEIRTSGSCGGGASSELRIRAKDGTIELRFEVRGARRGSWRVVVVQERRIAWRGTVSAGGSSRSFRVERDLDDLPGADAIMVRASGPRGLTCNASGTLSGS
jgi:hypothetical protein